MFMKIKDAYKILIDDQKREEYNNKIGKKKNAGFLKFFLVTPLLTEPAIEKKLGK